MSDDLLREQQQDDELPATRGEVRAVYQRVRRDLKWYAIIGVVGNQTLAHVSIPATAGFAGAAVLLTVAFLKLLIVR